MNDIDTRDLLLKNLNGALKSKKLYPPGHPAVAAPAKKSFELVSNALKTSANVMFGIMNGAFVFEGDAIPDGEKLYPDLMSHLTEKNIDAVIFEKGVTEKELINVVDILSGTAAVKGEEIKKELDAKGVTHITLKSMPIGKKNALEVYNGALETVKNTMSEVRLGKIPKSGPVKEVISELTDAVFTDQNAMLGLTMIKNYDNYLFNHSVNVSVLAISLGRALGLEKEELDAVGVGGLLHDIGKTGVAENIIRKPGGLSSEEWDKIKEHPQLGSNITKRMEGLHEIVGHVVYEHHIRYDHSGYPQTTEKLHPLSQIITICDAYDALTTVRVYQQPHNPVEAIKVMVNFSGRHFSPDILKAFVNMLGLYPVGTMVRLSTNAIGVVIRLNPENGERPVVKLIYGPDGASLHDSPEVDLSANADKHIVSTVNPVVTNTDIGAFFEKESAAAA
ncbi:MAG: HD-GYP domain-containing protein [Deltaproteobacteria bacterium]|nr:HD-GYP domain-containing protein [Deltaproteobacteria bacterium]